MEETTAFQDWELLKSSDAAVKISDGIDDNDDHGSEDGAIKSNYFALDSEERHPRRAPSEEESEDGGVDSDNPSWMDPDSDSRYVDRTRGEMGFAAMGFRRNNFGGFWSDDSSDGQRSLPDSENGELGNTGDSITEVGFEGVEAGRLNSGGIVSPEDLDLGEIGGGEGFETGHEKHDELLHGESVKMNQNNLTAGEREKRGMVWWKMPFELLKFCVLRVRPIWSISIAAAFVGFFMLGRRLYKMKNKSRSIPLKISIDDKKASQFMVRAARLNEAISVVRRVPIIRPSLQAPAGGVTPWPVVSFR